MINNNIIIENLHISGIENAAAFDTDILAFSQDIRAMCEMNTCGRYNRSWNCPPVIGTLESLRDICLKFKHGILCSTVTKLEDSFDFEGMMRASATLCVKLGNANRIFADLSARHGTSEIQNAYRIFGAGSCSACKKCSYPDAPCIHPDRFFIPIEACGINVVELASNTGLAYNNGPNTVTFFGMVLYN
ncbi:MAG: DUF2284 domain-containing protein [Clostridiales Family XIII bacterium]|jgi:predicted metal-binding protein|nr:DUF2284 domain-containing protein [Clostridiales Family XIII bacterium]